MCGNAVLANFNSWQWQKRVYSLGRFHLDFPQVLNSSVLCRCLTIVKSSQSRQSNFLFEFTVKMSRLGSKNGKCEFCAISKVQCVIISPCNYYWASCINICVVFPIICYILLKPWKFLTDEALWREDETSLNKVKVKSSCTQDLKNLR